MVTVDGSTNGEDYTEIDSKSGSSNFERILVLWISQNTMLLTECNGENGFM